MACPLVEPLDALIDALAHEAYDAHRVDIDVQIARIHFCKCMNCGARGRFTYTGMKSERSCRAFWT